MNKEIYFEYNGTKYYAGTKFKMKESQYKVNIVEAVFCGPAIFFDGEFSIMYEDKNCYGQTRKNFLNVKPEDLPDKIIEIVEGNYYTELEARKRYIKDSNIPELFLGWIAYIFVMLGLLLFNNWWLSWIVVSIFFFNKRKKIKEENYYYE